VHEVQEQQRLHGSASHGCSSPWRMKSESGVACRSGTRLVGSTEYAGYCVPLPKTNTM
jgi:hypothetical protein